MSTTVHVLGNLWKYVTDVNQLEAMTEIVFPNGSIVSYKGKHIGCRSVYHFVQMLEDYDAAVRGSLYDRFLYAFENVIGHPEYLNELKNAIDPEEHLLGKYIGSTRDEKINEMMKKFIGTQVIII